MILPIVHLVATKTIGSHVAIRTSARRHIGGVYKFGHNRIGVMANKRHTKYFSHQGKRWYFREKI